MNTRFKLYRPCILPETNAIITNVALCKPNGARDKKSKINPEKNAAKLPVNEPLQNETKRIKTKTASVCQLKICKCEIIAVSIKHKTSAKITENKIVFFIVQAPHS